MSPAGLWRQILLDRLQTQLFPQRCQAFSVHLRQHSLLQNPTVLLEGPACEDVHDRTQCHPSVSPTHHFLSYVFTVLSTCLWLITSQVCALELPWNSTGGLQLHRGPRSGAFSGPGKPNGSPGHPAPGTVYLCRMGNGEKVWLEVGFIVVTIWARTTSRLKRAV